MTREELIAALAQANAEIERLSGSLGAMNADFMGMRDGALVRDLQAQNTRLQTELTTARSDALEEVASLAQNEGKFVFASRIRKLKEQP